MVFKKSLGMRYFSFESFESLNLTHAIFTRRGGVSPKPWDSLNMGNVVGDDPQKVGENRVRAFRGLDRDPKSMYDVWQVHSAEVVCVDAPRGADVPHIQADAILTDNPEVTLFMRFADCVPILLFDPRKKVAGIVHAGWRGTIKKIGLAAVQAMVINYGSNPADILAGIGPSISVERYEVGQEVVDQVEKNFSKDAGLLLQKLNGGVKFDLWKANRLLLEQAGLVKIEVAGICTASHPEDWYSHRGEYSKTGRFGVLIGLNKEV